MRKYGTTLLHDPIQEVMIARKFSWIPKLYREAYGRVALVRGKIQYVHEVLVEFALMRPSPRKSVKAVSIPRNKVLSPRCVYFLSLFAPELDRDVSSWCVSWPPCVLDEP